MLRSEQLIFADELRTSLLIGTMSIVSALLRSEQLVQLIMRHKSGATAGPRHIPGAPGRGNSACLGMGISQGLPTLNE